MQIDLSFSPEILDRLKNCRRMAVLTGAGVSAESGIPTFRGAGGLWKNYRAEELATPQAFARNPGLVWEWYAMRREIISRASPNPAHLAIVELENHFETFALITQNIDGLHRRAGSQHILEIHGNIWKARCTSCSLVFELQKHPLPLPELPACPDCSSLARPHVVWFGENYDQSLLAECAKIVSEIDVLVVSGTSGMVSVPVWLAEEAGKLGACILEFNLEQSQISSCANASIIGRAGETLPQFLNLIKHLRN